MLVYFMTIWNILWPFDIIYGRLVQFVAIWYIYPVLVCLDHEKSGNPGFRVKLGRPISPAAPISIRVRHPILTPIKKRVGLDA
jgi:hypothetical protein